MKTYSAPYMKSVLPDGGSEDVILESNKPVVVIAGVILAEGRDDGDGIKPLEECPEGLLVRDVDHQTKHEFDTVNEALEFVKVLTNPDKNPMSVSVYQFHPDFWKKIAGF